MIKNLPTLWTPKMESYDHQKKTFSESRDMKYYALFWEMGTCKSKVIMDTVAHLFMKGEIDGVILISDNGCYMNWPNKEIPKHMPDGIPYRVGVWSSYMLRKDAKKLEEIMTAKDDTLDFLCMNVESFSGSSALVQVKRFINNHYCLMCVDESTSIKNIKSARTKNIIEAGKLVDYRRILTGTPITQGPLDLYAQCEFLQEGLLGYKSFVAFKSDHAVVKQIPSGRWHYDVILGYMNLDRLYKSLQPFSSRVLKTECMDLPDKVYETIYVEQTPEQEDHYRTLKTTAVLELEQGLLTSTSAIVTIMKLHQINCGHLKLDDGTMLEIPNNRIKVLIETLEKILPSKVVIWCRFQHDVEMIIAALKKHWEKDPYYPVHYYGPTTEAERVANLYRFQNDSNCLWFVGTASTGGKGIDGLQDVCSYEIYYSNSYDREDRAQSEDRLHRNGQKNNVTIIDMVVQGTVDVKIWDALKRKEDLAFQVLDKFREIVT